MKDEDFKNFLEALSADYQRPALKHLIYTNQNELSYKAVETINNLYLSKGPPDNLESLRIVNCKV